MTNGLRDEAKYAARGGMTRAQVKRAVRERDGHRCAKCGMTAARHRKRYGKALEVHRTTPGSLYTLAGCVTLCCACHGPEPYRQPGQVDMDGPKHPRMAFHMSAALAAALDAYIEATRPRPSGAECARVALEEFLEKRGFWPPKKE